MQAGDLELHCLWCGWCWYADVCHVEHSPFCPTVRANFHVWVDEDGELCSRKRDILWIVPRLISWSRCATARVEASYSMHMTVRPER